MLVPLLLVSVASFLAPSDPVPAAPPGPPARLATPVSASRPAEALVPRDWLVLAPVDGRGRRPFRPDAVFAAHLLARNSVPPSAGDEVTGESGDARWAEVTADDAGRVEGAIGYAYAEVVSETDRVLIARLAGASTLFVNGDAHVGDVYRLGFGGVPVHLERGVNRVFVTGARGGFSLRFDDPPAPQFVAGWDVTRPDLRADALGQRVSWAAVVVVNASTRAGRGLRLEVSAPGVLEPATLEVDRELAPLSVTKLAVPWHVVADTAGDERERWTVRLLDDDGPVAGSEVEFGVPWRDGDDAYRRTFVSAIDGSVQQYAVRPVAGVAQAGDDLASVDAGLLLSLHGAGVDCLNQARSYAPKPDLWVVAPTNRREFGFDWQDWGRLDAYEVLHDALALTGVDRSRVALTGHSMGGHGTWHLAANDLDGFAAIGPCASWASFDAYGGRPDGARQPLWHAADAASSTEALIGNLAQLPVFIWHGERDRTVPVELGRAMEEALREAGAAPHVRYEPEAGHWWDPGDTPGADCMDWPPLIEMLSSSRIAHLPDEIDVTLVDPVVDARHHWVTVVQPWRYGAPVRVRGTRGPGAVELLTENARRLELDAAVVRGPVTVRVDGDVVLEPTGPRRHALVVERTAGRWRATDEALASDEKRPDRSGPFKRAFDHSFVLVVPTRGTAEEVAEGLARARYDASVWWYRANGDAPIVTDVAFVAQRTTRYAARHVILYGNADTNAAWRLVLGRSTPLVVERGVIALGAREWRGDDLAAVFVRPRADDARALVGAFASTGTAGSRLGYTLAPFVSGVGYPDYTVFGAGVLSEGDGGVLEAGWWDRFWRLDAAR